MLIRRGRLPDGHVADIRVDERIRRNRRSASTHWTPSRCLTRRPVRCCQDCTTITYTCGRWPRRWTRSPSGRRRSGPKRNWHRHLRPQSPGPDGWIRAVGYHASVAGELDREQLDALVADTPLRIQHRSGAMWILNSAGLARVGLADHPDGRLHSADDWSDALPRRATALADITHRLAGVRRHRSHRRHSRPHRR